MHSYFRVAISWGNKMNFSLSANMWGFCSDSHTLIFYINNKQMILHTILLYTVQFYFTLTIVFFSSLVF